MLPNLTNLPPPCLKLTQASVLDVLAAQSGQGHASLRLSPTLSFHFSVFGLICYNLVLKFIILKINQSNSEPLDKPKVSSYLQGQQESSKSADGVRSSRGLARALRSPIFDAVIGASGSCVAPLCFQGHFLYVSQAGKLAA